MPVTKGNKKVEEEDILKRMKLLALGQNTIDRNEDTKKEVSDTEGYKDIIKEPCGAKQNKTQDISENNTQNNGDTKKHDDEVDQDIPREPSGAKQSEVQDISEVAKILIWLNFIKKLPALPDSISNMLRLEVYEHLKIGELDLMKLNLKDVSPTELSDLNLDCFSVKKRTSS